ncbi:MAG: hypothetical protein QQN41_01345 [Nitrosopumilus sp.]
MKYILSILKWIVSFFASTKTVDMPQSKADRLYKQRRCTNCSFPVTLKKCRKRNESGTVGCIDPWTHRHAYCLNKKCKFVEKVYVSEVGERI